MIVGATRSINIHPAKPIAAKLAVGEIPCAVGIVRKKFPWDRTGGKIDGGIKKAGVGGFWSHRDRGRRGVGVGAMCAKGLIGPGMLLNGIGQVDGAGIGLGKELLKLLMRDVGRSREEKSLSASHARPRIRLRHELGVER